MKKSILLIVSLLVVSFGIVPITVQAVEISTFVFLDQFPENSVALGFPKERVIQVGAFVKTGDTNIKEVNCCES